MQASGPWGPLPAEIAALGMMREFGRSERIRTSDPLLPKQVRYQTALRSDRGRGVTPSHSTLQGGSPLILAAFAVIEHPEPCRKARAEADVETAAGLKDGAVLGNARLVFAQDDVDA